MDVLNPYQAQLRTEKKKKIVKQKNLKYKKESSDFKKAIEDKIANRIEDDQRRINETLAVTRLK